MPAAVFFYPIRTMSMSPARQMLPSAGNGGIASGCAPSGSSDSLPMRIGVCRMYEKYAA